MEVWLSHNHCTVGFEAIEAYIEGLKAGGISVEVTLKEEAHIRGADFEHGCYCAYTLDVSPGIVVEVTTEYSDEEFEAVLTESVAPEEHNEARIIRAQMKEHGKPVCPCCLGTCGHTQRLRIVRYTTVAGEAWVAEEYLKVRDLDCDGESVVGFATYKDGERPELTTTEVW